MRNKLIYVPIKHTTFYNNTRKPSTVARTTTSEIVDLMDAFHLVEHMNIKRLVGFYNGETGELLFDGMYSGHNLLSEAFPHMKITDQKAGQCNGRWIPFDLSMMGGYIFYHEGSSEFNHMGTGSQLRAMQRAVKEKVYCKYGDEFLIWKD